MTTVYRKKWVGSDIVLTFDDGRVVRITWESEDGTDDEGIEVYVDRKQLTSANPEVELSDLYAPTGLPLETMLGFREEVFQQHLRDEEHREEERREKSLTRRRYF